jgi:hypothetical protein
MVLARQGTTAMGLTSPRIAQLGPEDEELASVADVKRWLAMIRKSRAVPDDREDAALLNRLIAAVGASVVGFQLRARIDEALSYISKRYLERQGKLQWIEDLATRLLADPTRWPKFKPERVPPEVAAVERAFRAAAPGQHLSAPKLITVIRKARGTSKTGAYKWLSQMENVGDIERTAQGVYVWAGQTHAAYVPLSQRILNALFAAGYRMDGIELNGKLWPELPCNIRRAVSTLRRAGVLKQSYRVGKYGRSRREVAPVFIAKHQRSEPICNSEGHVFWAPPMVPRVEDVVLTTLRRDRPPLEDANVVDEIREIAGRPGEGDAACEDLAQRSGLRLGFLRSLVTTFRLSADGERRPHLEQRPRLSLDQIAGAAPGVPLRPPIALGLQDKWSLQVSTDKPPPGFGAKFAYMAKIAGIFLVHINSKGGKCCPSYETIASEAACSKQTAIDMIKLLERRGHLGVERPARHGKGHHNRYTLLIKPDPAAAKGLHSGDLFDGVKGLDPGGKRSLGGSQKVSAMETGTPEVLEPGRERPSGAARSPKRTGEGSKKNSQLPEGWKLCEVAMVYGRGLGYSDDEIKWMAEGFRLWCKKNNARMADPSAAFQSWMLKEPSFKSSNRSTGGTAPFKPRERPRVATEARNLTNEQWLKVLVEFRVSCRWNEAKLGPKPNEPGCFAPKELWEDAGLVDDTTRPPRPAARPRSGAGSWARSYTATSISMWSPANSRANIFTSRCISGSSTRSPAGSRRASPPRRSPCAVRCRPTSRSPA